MKPYTLILTILLALTAQSCFTGVDSTPRIKQSEVRRSQPQSKAEDTYLQDIRRQSVDQWQPGKPFWVSDERISVALNLPASQSGLSEGDTIYYRGLEEITTVTGERVAVVILTDSRGRELRYRTASELRQLRENGFLEIPYAIDLDIVNQLRGRLQGQTYYLMTQSVYDLQGQPARHSRFIPVRVELVEPGNAYYPARLTLIDERGQQFRLFMSIDSDQRMPRRFAAMLSLSDPRLRYPQISDSNWRSIVNGRVAEGMTQEEARLAIGSPANIDQQPGYSYLREVWTYDGGIYLIFEDGILRAFRQ